MNERDERRVDDFFAAHRARVPLQDADEQTWEVITSRASARAGRSRGVWFLAGAVAASAVAVAVLASQGLGDRTPLSPAGSGTDDVVISSEAPAAPTGEGTEDATTAPTGEVTDDGATEEDPGATQDDATGSATETGGGSATDDPGDESTADAPVAFELPAADPAAKVSFVEELTGDESKLRTALYGTDCAAGEVEWFCPGLAVSEDSGRTWEPRVDMYAAGYYGAVSAREHIWMWAQGGDRPDIPEPKKGLVRSDDGGRTWVDVPTKGDGVIWVEAFRSTLVVVTKGCEGGAGGECMEIVITDITADDASSGRREITIDNLPADAWGGPGPLPDHGALQATYDAIYLVMPGGDTAYRIADDEQVATKVERPNCSIMAAPDSQDSLVSWCHGEETVSVSSDGGKTWKDQDGPGGVVEALVSNDGRRLVAASEDGLFTGHEGEWDKKLDPVTDTRLFIRAYANDEVRFGSYLRYHADEGHLPRFISNDDGESWAEQPDLKLWPQD